MRTYTGPLNNSDLHACIWHDGRSFVWHVYVPFADRLTDAGRADTFDDAMSAAMKAA